MAWFKKSASTLSTPAPPRAATESNSVFVLIGFGILAAIVIGAVMAGVALFGRRNSESAMPATAAAMQTDNAPLIDMDKIRNRKPLKIPEPPADPDDTPQLPPPDDTPAPAAALPPPTNTPATAKKEWVKPTMHSGGGSVRGGSTPAGGNGRGDGGGGGVQMAQAGPRNDREAFAATAGRGRKLYHDQGELGPLPGCVAKAGRIVQLVTLGVTKNSAPGQFTLKVVEPYQGTVYDQRRGPRACTNPLIPVNSTVMCEPNIVSSGRGDQIIQAVCSRIDFPNGGTLPLDGFPLVAADGSVGVPAESDYPWSDVLKGMAIDIASAIPGALMTASAGALSGGGAGVILNVGADGFERSAQQYKSDEVKIQKVLFIPRGASTGLFIPADVALPDRRR